MWFGFLSICYGAECLKQEYVLWIHTQALQLIHGGYICITMHEYTNHKVLVAENEDIFMYSILAAAAKHNVIEMDRDIFSILKCAGYCIVSLPRQ